MPFFSIIIPVYNVEKYLHECVDSILTQSFSDYEVILVDDGSPDNCGKICDEYAEKDIRVKVIHKENGGLSDARNSGVRKAVGQYICLVDSDDGLADYNALQKAHDALDKSGFPDVLITHRNTNCSNNISGKEYLSLTFRRWKEKQLIDIVVWDKIYKKEMLDLADIEFLKGYVHEDDFWTLAILSQAGTCSECEIDFCFHRENLQSITKTVTQKAISSRSTSKMYIANHSIQFFKQLNHDDLYVLALSFYLPAYLSGLKAGLKLTEPKYIEKYNHMVSQTQSICLGFRHLNSLKYKVLYIAYKLGGISWIQKLLKRMG